MPVYRFPLSQRKLSDIIVKNMLSQDVMEESNSHWNFPLFLVPKKDSTNRPVVDYSQLNKHCQQEKYPLPVLQDILMFKIGCFQHLTYGQVTGKCH